MKTQVLIKNAGLNKSSAFDPNHLVSNEDFCKNLNAIIAYYQISKGGPKKRFISR
jgi:hypothetical protein